MTPSERTFDQKRAAHALSKVREIERGGEAEFQRNYRSYVESLPATIVMNGLGQACATLLARGGGRSSSVEGSSSPRKEAYHRLYEHLEAWLCREKGAVYNGGNSLIDAIVSNDQQKYIHAQAEALAYLDWLKKFAQAFLKGNSASTEGESDAR